MDEIDKNVRRKKIYGITLMGSAVNVALVLFKFIAGIIGHSTAMIADAVHSLSDLATDVIVLVFVRISDKPEDKGHDYGHGKYETFATLLIGVALFLVAAHSTSTVDPMMCSPSTPHPVHLLLRHRSR